MAKKFFVSVQSFSDVITNSSSELFVVGADKEKTAKDLESMLIKYRDDTGDGYSGMGGEITVEDFRVNATVDQWISNFFYEVGCENSHLDPITKQYVPDYVPSDEVVNSIINKEKLLEYVKKRRAVKNIPEDGFLIDIDHNCRNTIGFIIEELKGVSFEW